VPEDGSDQFDYSGSEWISMPAEELDGPLRGAILLCLPEGATYEFEAEHGRAWIVVSRPGDTRRVLSAARRLLGRA
jgi:hypothetical protein